MAERRIRELRNHARTMLIHASRKWPAAIEAPLWPYALRLANDLHNNLPSTSGGASPIEIFSSRKLPLRPKVWHHFGAPAYVLMNQLQQGKSYPKWSERARIGVYLGQSPKHSSSTALILNVSLGCVSPQFHSVIDSSFGSSQLPESSWQDKCYFRTCLVPCSDSHLTSDANTKPPYHNKGEGVLDVTDPSGRAIQVQGPTGNPDSLRRDQLQAQYVRPSRKRAAPDCLTYSAEAEIDHLNPLQESTPEVSQLCFVTQLGSACDTLCLHQVLRANDEY
jgi:hypothetical protein